MSHPIADPDDPTLDPWRPPVTGQVEAVVTDELPVIVAQTPGAEVITTRLEATPAGSTAGVPAAGVPAAGVPAAGVPAAGVMAERRDAADLLSERAARAAALDVQPSSLIASDITAWFGDHKVLERCSLRMEANQVTALIGPSGCGKSTFIRILNRMHETIRGAKVAGSVDLDGTDIYGHELTVTEVRVRIGMVFQKPNPFPSMSIYDNVLAGLKLAGKRTGDKDELVESSLRRAGLWAEVKDRLHAGGTSLSGGQQQRLCIARSLAVKPKVLLMDEPCSALDPISTRVVEETIKELAHEVTIVIVTHNMQQAQRVSDQCAFFLVEDLKGAGRIVEAGPTDKMFNDPDDPRTLDYVMGRFG